MEMLVEDRFLVTMLPDHLTTFILKISDQVSFSATFGSLMKKICAGISLFDVNDP
jgi:hypothetical protein